MKRTCVVALVMLLSAAVPSLSSAEWTAEPDPFSPAISPGTRDTVQIGGDLDQEVPVTLKIRNAGGSLVRTFPPSQVDSTHGSLPNRAVWDGRDGAGAFVPDGDYTIGASTSLREAWVKGNASGTRDGEFEGPRDAAVAADGTIYVADVSSRIQVFAADRSYLKSFDVMGDALAVRGTRLYVLRASESRVRILDRTTGTQLGQFGSYGTGDGQFRLDWKNNLAVDSAGNVWVVDSGNSRIQKFDQDGVFLAKYGSAATFNFSTNKGWIAIDGSERLYVTDSGRPELPAGRIQVFSSGGVWQRSIVTAYDGGPSQLYGIDNVAVGGPDNRIYVSSFNRNVVVILNNNGTFHGRIGPADGSPSRLNGKFYWINGIKVVGGKLWTAEPYDNLRVQAFDLEGTYLFKIGMSQGEFFNPVDVALAPAGNVFVADRDNKRVQVFSPAGAFVSQILVPYHQYQVMAPTDLAFDADGRLYATGQGNYALNVFSTAGDLLRARQLEDGSGNMVVVKGAAVLGTSLYVAGGAPPAMAGTVYKYALTCGQTDPEQPCTPQATFGSFDFGDQYDGNGSLAASGGFLHLLDMQGDDARVQVFDAAGALQKTLIMADRYFANDLAVDPEGRIFLTSNAVGVFDPSGSLLYEFGPAGYDTGLDFTGRGVAVDGAGKVYLTDDDHRLRKFDTRADVSLGEATVEVDNTPPSAAIVYPPHDPPANLPNGFQVRGTATDVNFAGYTLRVDGSLHVTGTSPADPGVLGLIDSGSLGEGLHTLRLSVADEAGNSAFDEVPFYVDRTAPSSYVVALAAWQKTLTFTVSWTGSDSGSGVAGYDVQYMEGDSGIWVDWLLGTAETSGSFTGVDGHLYRFRCRARDNGGALETYPAVPDTETRIDISPPFMVKATPPDGAYVGATPGIVIEVADPLPGSGVTSSGMAVRVDGSPHGYSFYGGKIRVNPTFTKGQHTVTADFRDVAGNWAAQVVLQYHALDFDGTIEPLDPDPNPTVSTVMAGGEVYRYYRVLNGVGEPAAGVALSVRWTKDAVVWYAEGDASDGEGIARVVLEADNLGDVGERVACSIFEAGGNSVSPTLDFDVEILPRESAAAYKFGSGISAQGAIGIGLWAEEKKGMVYSVLNTDPGSSSDDRIRVKRSREAAAGVYAGASVGGGVEGAAYAQAAAEAKAGLVFNYANSYLFGDPYGSDEQMILRSGLVIASLLEQTGLPLVSQMIGFVIDGYNPFYNDYKDGQEFALGVRLGASASAGTGLGLGDKENVFLGFGVGAGIEGEVEILARLTSAFTPPDYPAPSELGAGLTFTGEVDLFAGLEGNVIADKIKGGVGGGLAGEYGVMLYFDPVAGVFDRAEVSVSGEKDFGVTAETTVWDPGTKETTVLTVPGEQVATVAQAVADLAGLSQYLDPDNDDSTPQVPMGPTQIAARFADLVDLLLDIQTPYRIEEETGVAYSFEPQVSLGLGIELQVGASLTMEKTVAFTKEEGFISQRDLYSPFGMPMPLASYRADEHVPDIDDLSFADVFEDCADGIWTALTDLGHLVEEGIEVVGDTAVDLVDWAAGGFGLSGRTGLAPGLPSEAWMVGRVYQFSPGGVTVAHLSSQIAAPRLIDLAGGACTILITPGEVAATITMTYSSGGFVEGDLRIFRWDEANRSWGPVDGVVVDSVTDRVTGSITRLGTYVLGVPYPDGPIPVRLTPRDVDPAARVPVVVKAGPVMMNTGEVAPDGTLVTVSSLSAGASGEVPFGTIPAAQDLDAGEPGVQVATAGGYAKCRITPPKKQGTGLVTVAAVRGNARGAGSFNVVRHLDTDGNGLPDYWERTFFGAIRRNPRVDPDGDGLKNRQEYLAGTDPTKADTDGDGLPDGWEVSHALNPLLDDAAGDPDRDGWSNESEFDAGSDPWDSASTPQAPLFDDFSDGRRSGDPDWRKLSGGWTVNAARKYLSAPTLNDIAVPKELPPLAATRVEADVTLTRNAAGSPNGAVLFALQDKGTYRYVRLKKGKVFLGQAGSLGGEASGLKASRQMNVRVGKACRVRVDVEPDGRVVVWLKAAGETDWTYAMEYKFDQAIAGKIGLAATRAGTAFDNVGVWNPAASPGP